MRRFYGWPIPELLGWLALLGPLRRRWWNCYVRISVIYCFFCCVGLRFLCIRRWSSWFLLKIIRFFDSSWPDLPYQHAPSYHLLSLYRNGLLSHRYLPSQSTSRSLLVLEKWLPRNSDSQDLSRTLPLSEAYDYRSWGSPNQHWYCGNS